MLNIFWKVGRLMQPTACIQFPWTPLAYHPVRQDHHNPVSPSGSGPKPTQWTALTFSTVSGWEKTRKAKPRDRPVVGSVFTFTDSISPNAPKYPRSSSGEGRGLPQGPAGYCRSSSSVGHAITSHRCLIARFQPTPMVQAVISNKNGHFGQNVFFQNILPIDAGW